MTETVTTAPRTTPLPITVTITATPTSSPTKTPASCSTPHSHGAPPSGASFFPPPNARSGLLRRGFMAAGDSLQFARGYDCSTATVTATSLAAGGLHSPAPTFNTITSPSLAARQFGGWSSSSSPSATLSSSFTLSPPGNTLLY